MRRSSVDSSNADSMVSDEHHVQSTVFGEQFEASTTGEGVDTTASVFPDARGGGKPRDRSAASEGSLSRIWSSSSDDDGLCILSTFSTEDGFLPKEAPPPKQEAIEESLQQQSPCTSDIHTGKCASRVADPAQITALMSQLAAARGTLNQKEVVIRSLRRQLDEVQPGFMSILGVPCVYPDPSVGPQPARGIVNTA